MPLFAETNWPMYLFAFGCAMAIGILLRRSRKYYSTFAKWQRDRRAAPPVKESYRAPPTNLEKPVSMQRWEIEMHEHTREMSAILDSKMIALQHLVHDAEAAAARLEATVARMTPVEQELGGEPVPVMNRKPDTLPTVSQPETTSAEKNSSPRLPPIYPADAFHGAYQGESG